MAPSTEVLSKKKGPPKKKATKAYRKTIHFNVGGTKYEVSKSLIETYPDTMLATMISDRWQHHDNDNDDDTNDGTTTDKVLFIDRNGHRFQYVLDYMRDQHVHSPMGVTGASIRKELEYFGFVNVPPDVINLPGHHQVRLVNFCFPPCYCCFYGTFRFVVFRFPSCCCCYFRGGFLPFVSRSTRV